jgi:ATP-binding cassette subfamily A (ABC1) protein 3
MFENYQTIKACKSIDKKVCENYPNPCCRYLNVNVTDPCGSDTDCLYWNENYWTWEKPGLLRYVICMIVQFIVQFTLIFLYETGFIRKVKYMFKAEDDLDENELSISKQQATVEEMYGDIPKDSDVIEEENRISLMNNNNNINNDNSEIFIVDKLTKHYSDFMAVKGISFAIGGSECFGLLGVNGAGKTSTFKMITGDEFITKGEAYLNEISIKKNIKQFQRQLGYCPQFDPLIDQMTVLETMFMYARLRGIKNNLLSKTCLSLIDLLDLKDHTNKMCYTLSGGNKRKLSVAIALVGSPTVILLDEPTS